MRNRALLARAPVRSEARLERCHGVAEIRFVSPDAKAPTHVAHLFQQTPCRVLFPRAEPGDPLTAVLLTTSGGITGGDSLRLDIAAGPGAAATVTTQAAEKIYRALDRDCTIDVTLDLGSGAWLEWLPQETILFDRARLIRRNQASLAPDARLLAAEMVVFGRSAHGERFAAGRLLDTWRIRRGGKLIWADGLRLDGDIGEALGHPAGLDGAQAAATVLYVGEDGPGLLERARALLETAVCRAGCTAVNGILLARFLGRDALALRRDVIGFCGALRALAAGLPARMPRVWAI